MSQQDTVVKTTTRKVKVLELKEKAVSKKQQRFFGMVRAAQKGEGAASPEVAKVAGEISKKDAKDFAKTKHKGLPEKKKIKEGLSVKDAKKLNKAAALSYSSNPKDQDRARARQVDVDYKDLLRQINARKKPNKPAVSKMKEDYVKEASAVLDANKKISDNEKREKMKKELIRLVKHAKDKRADINRESFEINKSEHKKVQKKAKLRNLAKGNMNPNEKAAAQKKAGGPKLYGEGYAKPKGMDDLPKGSKVRVKKGVKVRGKYVKEGKTFDSWKKAAASALGRKKEERKAKPATDAGARARKKLKDAEHHKYVSFLDAPDD